MTIFRLRLRTSSLVTALVCTAWLSACGDGDNTTEPTGGTSGSGASGGGAGKGGTAGKGGSAGSAGSSAGAANAAGSGEGGEAGAGVGGSGASGGEGATAGQGATGGEGATAGQGEAGLGGSGAGGEGGVSSGGAGGTSEGGEGGLSLGGMGGEAGAPVTCDFECGAECVDLDVGVEDGETTNHCGVCDRACSLANASAAACSGGECVPACDDGFGDCVADDGSGPDDGCETNLDLGNVSGASVDDCGACGRDCSLDGATASACDTGLCEPTCAPNRADCEPDDGSGEDDGCESDLTEPATCGTCEHACSTANTTATACNAGQCEPTCAPGFLDCNVDDANGEDDGCETVTTAESCGTSCDNLVACEVEQGCRIGVCEPSGLAVLTIPFTAGGQTQRYGASHATDAVDLTDDIVHVRLYAPGATGGSVNTYLIGPTGPGPGVIRELSTLNSEWTTISIPVGVADGTWDPSQVRQVTFDVSSSGDGPWANPTIIYVDRVWSDNGLLNDRFPASVQPPMVMSGLTAVPNSTLTWTALRP